MKAWVLHEIGNFRLEEVQKPSLSEGEVLVRVRAAGVCGSDVPRIYRDGAHAMPLIPGHEFSGEVVDVKEEGNSTWIGKRVGVFPLIPCRTCVACKMGRHEMCRSYSYLGSRRDGGFAEYVAVPVDNLIELPEKVSFVQAAMLEPMSVAVHAMRRVNRNEGDTVVVCGLGTIGIFLTMFLLQSGVKNLLVIGNKEYQKKQVLSLGLNKEQYFDRKEGSVKEWIMEKTKGLGANLFFECVGKNETVLQAIDLTIPGGKVCLVGNPFSDMIFDKNVYWKILRNQLEVTGTWNSTFFGKENMLDLSKSDWKYVIDLLEDEKIKPEQFISHLLQFKELEKGTIIMRDKTEDYLKVMIEL